MWLGKLTLTALRLIGRRGNALPGLVVEKVFPAYLRRAMARLPEGVVVVTGTNGKTTTTKMVATLLARRYRVLTNDTGSNFVRGAITATVEHSTWAGRLPYDVAVFELDEAWAVRFVERVTPRRALLLNVMRDQLDRFGEIDTTAALLGKVAAATTGHVVLNRDDERVAALASRTTAAVTYYGVAPDLREAFPTDEELYGGPVHHSDLATTAELLRLPDRENPPLQLRIGDSTHDVVLRAEGPHNAQNAAGAAALALTFDLTPDDVAAGLADVSPAFGRGQRFRVDGRDVVLQLVKNPAGFRQTLRTLDDGTPEDGVVVVINDDYADGRDVSWLWDVDFSALREHRGRIATSGTRAADMALRLHYDDVDAADVQADPEKAVRAAVAAAAPDTRVVVFSTYTAMWSLHAILQRIGVGGSMSDACGARQGHERAHLVHLYPREMNIYGDTGNVVVLRRRLQWRGREVRVVPVSVGDPLPTDADILLGGGGQDAAQGDIGADFAARAATLRAMADDGVVMLAICGSFQMLGHAFITHEGRTIEGTGVLDVITRGQPERLIGNNFVDTADTIGAGRLVGYENHSGLTELGSGVRPLGSTQAGRGNNGTDRTEGAVRDNVIGTYLHGPVLAKSPRFADDLLRRALVRRGRDADLEPLDDGLAERAAAVAVGRPR